jgi:hypothetical protein
MRDQAISLQTLAESSELQTTHGIKVIIRKRNLEPGTPLKATLSDSQLTKEDGWMWVAANESVIYADIKEKNDGMSQLH